MAEPVVFSSQGSQYEEHQILPDVHIDDFIFGSGAGESKDVTDSIMRKPKKPPTITPKRFTRFFTPRNTVSSRRDHQSKAGRQLRDITKNGANRRRSAAQIVCVDYEQHDEYAPVNRPMKRRKQSFDIASSPLQSSPLKHARTKYQVDILEDLALSPAVSDVNGLADILEDTDPFPRPIRRLRNTGGSQQRILHRSFGGHDAISRGRKGSDHCADWKSGAANFVSSSAEMYSLTGPALPFCTASCNTNSLVAIGDEQGGVQLLDSSRTSKFTKSHVAFRPHQNAIMDIAFASDDYTMATASGDQTTRVIDMLSQRTLCILSGHKSSVKQARFHPDNDNMITTSSRDGTVMLWDLRCSEHGSVASLRYYARLEGRGDEDLAIRYSIYALDAGTAHRSSKPASTRTASTDGHDGVGASITAMEHLAQGREHILLTTSEVNSSVKIWDLRNVGRRSSSALLSSTPVPSNHRRNYGITSMTLSSDGSRLYTACRDGIVYAYSTNHLVLGSAPEMSSSSSKRRTCSKEAKTGLGPLYGFKHPSLRVATFYIKAAMRSTRTGHSEMLALGSSDNCAVLFPTDERHLPARGRSSIDENEEDEVADLPSFPAHDRKASRNPSLEGDIPIYNHGTALIRGHNKEVTSLTWSHDGDLATVSDDYSARCWREDASEARRLRGCGEGGGQRWGYGWADIDRGLDEEDG